jgi:hypothetical protein
MAADLEPVQYLYNFTFRKTTVIRRIFLPAAEQKNRAIRFKSSEAPMRFLWAFRSYPIARPGGFKILNRLLGDRDASSAVSTDRLCPHPLPVVRSSFFLFLVQGFYPVSV